jgi:hypothetical protein
MPSQMAGLKRYCSTVSTARDRSEVWASAPHRGHEYTMSHPRALISVPTWPPFCQRARPVAPRTCPNLFRMVHFRGRNQDPMQESNFHQLIDRHREFHRMLKWTNLN